MRILRWSACGAVLVGLALSAAAQVPGPDLPEASQGRAPAQKPTPMQEGLALEVTKEGTILLRGKEVDKKELEPLIQRALADAKKDAASVSVVLRTDSETPWKQVKGVMDLLTSAGVEKLEYSVRGRGLPAVDLSELVLDLSGDGVLRTRGSVLSLANLVAVLRDRRGRQGKTVHVLLRADRAAPWAHVAWILNVLSEEGYDQVSFAVRTTGGGEGRLAAGMQKEAGQKTVAVEVAAGQTAAEEWGPAPEIAKEVQVVRTVRYRFGGQTSEVAQELRQWLGSQDSGAVGEIRAAGPIPHRFVVAALDAFYAAGIQKVRLRGAKPPAGVRSQGFLPFPKAEEAAAGAPAAK